MDLNRPMEVNARRNSCTRMFALYRGTFKLGKPTLALDIVNGKRVVVTVPTGAIVEVVSGPTDEDGRLIDVIWDGRAVRMFALDVRERGTEIRARSAKASANSRT
jgi:hypothetical protein